MESSLGNYSANIFDERMPDFVRYATYKCIFCGYQPIYFNTDLCPICKLYNMHPSVPSSDLSITVGAILLTQIYRYCYGNKFGIHKAENNLRIEQMNNIELLEFVDLNDKKIRTYLAKTFSCIMDDYNGKNSWSFLPSDRKKVKQVTLNNFEDICNYYINQFNEVKKYVSSSKNISEIVVDKLFGFHSYKLKFNSNEPISIIYGTNGMGKTTIFKILNSLLIEYPSEYGDFEYLCLKIPFARFVLTFADDSQVDVSKDNDTLLIRYRRRYGLGFDTISAPLEINFKDKRNFKKNVKEHYKRINELFPSINSRNRFLFVNTYRDGTLVKVEKALEELLTNYQRDSLLINDASNSNVFLKTLENSIRKNMNRGIVRICALINTENNVDLQRFPKLIAKCIDDICECYEAYQNCFEDYDSLDSNEEDKPIWIYEDNIKMYSLLCNNSYVKDRLEKIKVETEQKKLPKYDDNSFSNHIQMNSFSYRPAPEIVNVFNLRIKELYEALQNFEIFKNSLEDFYNEYDPSYKKVSIELDGNPRFIYECSNGVKLEETKLSSGEINLISILCAIAFNTTKDSIVLIDEPEISLHMIWVQQLTDSIAKIIKNKENMQVIMSSHSPFLAAGHEEYLVEGELLEEGD